MRSKGRDADCDVPEAPNPGGGPAPHYAKGGRAKKWVEGEGEKSRRRLDRPGRARGGAEKWIQNTGVSENKGGLHRALHVPEGEPIPAKKLAAGLDSDSPHIRHMSQFAKNVKGLG